MLDITGSAGEPRKLELRGELDLATAPILIERATPLLEDEGDVVLGLHGVTFVDSQGVRAFIRLAKGLAGQGTLVLEDPGREVTKLFDIVRISDFPNIEVRRSE